MKRITLVLFALVLGFSTLFSQNVTIPDANFLTALIEEGVDTNEDGQISYAEAEAVTDLYVSGRMFDWQVQYDTIYDMTGIEAFVNLETLDCKYNQLTSLDVSNNYSLGYLSCSDNQLTSLDFTNNIELIGLDCSTNLLNSLNVSNCTALTKLTCPRNQLTSLDVSYFTALTHLDCGANQLTSLDVSTNTALTRLRCYENQLTSLDVSFNDNFKTVDCANNHLTSLYFPKCYALTAIFCHGNQLTMLNVSDCTELRYIDCGGNQLTNLDFSSNKKLGQYGNMIDLSSMPSLHQVCVCESFFSEYASYDITGSPNVYFTTDCTIGIEENSFSDLSIYPNPTNSLLTIETDQPNNHSIEIISISGQSIYRTKMNGNSKQIDLTPFNKGIYFVKLRSKEFVRTEKVVKL